MVNSQNMAFIPLSDIDRNECSSFVLLCLVLVFSLEIKKKKNLTKLFVIKFVTFFEAHYKKLKVLKVEKNH